MCQYAGNLMCRYIGLIEIHNTPAKFILESPTSNTVGIKWGEYVNVTISEFKGLTNKRFSCIILSTIVVKSL